MVVALFVPLLYSSQSVTTGARVRTLEQAAAYLQRGDAAGAESLLRPLLDSSPNDAVALNLEGLVETQKHDEREAERLFRRAIAESRDKLPGPHVNLALLDATSRPLDALSELHAALAIKPDDKQAQELVRSISKQAALNAMQSGDNSQALEMLTRARQELPHDPEISFNLGMVLYRCGANGDAETALRQALEQRPGDSEAIYALARVYLAESKPGPAEEKMREYLRSHPKDATAQYGLGYILVAEQKIPEAKAAFEESLALQPNQTESLFQLGEIALAEGENAMAQQKLGEVLRRDPHHGGALTDMGLLSFKDSDYGRAKEQLEQAILSAPTYQKAHYYLALTLFRMGDKTAASREFNTAKALQKPRTPDLHLTPALQ